MRASSRDGTGLRAVATAAIIALLVASPSLALPRPYGNYLFGPSMIRSEAVLMAEGAIHEYRLDRGAIRSVSVNSLTLRERDGLVVRVPVASHTRVELNGRSVPLTALRPNMEATTIQRGADPAQRVDAIQPAVARHRTLGRFFGPSMLRAETVLRVGGVNHDYRVDRGRIKAISVGSITLRERDGLVLTVEVAPDAQIELKGRLVPFTALRRGMDATAISDGGEPVETLQVTPRR
jgi:hypothetical protein